MSGRRSGSRPTAAPWSAGIPVFAVRAASSGCLRFAIQTIARKARSEDGSDDPQCAVRPAASRSFRVSTLSLIRVRLSSGQGADPPRSPADWSRVARNSLSGLQFGQARELARSRPRSWSSCASSAMPLKSQARSTIRRSAGGSACRHIPSRSASPRAMPPFTRSLPSPKLIAGTPTLAKEKWSER